MSALEILFEDNHLLILNKKAGLLTQPSGTDHLSLECLAKDYLREKKGKTGAVFLEAIHRLDRQVEGIVVFAKTSKALSRLNKNIRLRNCKKLYRAWILAAFKSGEGILEDTLLHASQHAKIVSRDHPRGKQARLSYKFIKTKGKKSLVEVELFTGRYHQIRCQLAEHFAPIVGDTKYGAEESLGDRIKLQHFFFSIPHPITEELLEISLAAQEFC